MVTLNPKFKLDKPSAEGETQIFLKLYINYERFVYSIKRKIHPNYWDDNKQKAKSIKADRVLQVTLSEINSQINKVDTEVKRLDAYYNHLGINPTREMLKNALDEKFGKPLHSIDKPKNLGDYIDLYIDEIENGSRLTDRGQKYQKGTVKNYKGFQAQLTSYQDSRRKRLDFDDITIDFYDDFVQYFNSKSYSINTIGRHIKNLKTIMRAAKEEGLHVNNEIERKKFKVLKADTEQIYLNEEELELLYKKDLSKKPHLEVARDVFLIGCFTALRFSDYSRIRKENLITTSDGNKALRIITQKTGEIVIIPIWHWMLEELLQKFDYNVPKTYEQKINSRIKDVGREAEIDELIEIEELKGGMKVKKRVPKYQLIMTHTARRSGATLMHKRGFPSISIMKITGHKLESNFMKYIRITKEETADRIIQMFKVEKPLAVSK